MTFFLTTRDEIAVGGVTVLFRIKFVPATLKSSAMVPV